MSLTTVLSAQSLSPMINLHWWFVGLGSNRTFQVPIGNVVFEEAAVPSGVTGISYWASSFSCHGKCGRGLDPTGS